MSSDKPKTVKPKVVRVLKEKKVSVEVPRSEPIDIPEPAEASLKPKKRKSRAKQPPTKEESMKALMDTSNELKQIVVDLKEDETKLSGMTLKQLPALLKETLQNLDEDIKEIDEQYNELLALPSETPSN